MLNITKYWDIIKEKCLGGGIMQIHLSENEMSIKVVIKNNGFDRAILLPLRIIKKVQVELIVLDEILNPGAETEIEFSKNKLDTSGKIEVDYVYQGGYAYKKQVSYEFNKNANSKVLFLNETDDEMIYNFNTEPVPMQKD